MKRLISRCARCVAFLRQVAGERFATRFRVVFVVGLGVQLATAEEPELRVQAIPLGAQSVDVVARHYGESRWLFCNLHDDEDTSVQAARQVLAEHSGRLVELRHTGQRLVGFRLGAREFRCDPNRIFTPAGVRRTLEKHSSWDREAQAVVEKLGQALLDLYALKDVAVVVALHNNNEARYAASSYLAGQDLEKEAEAVSLADGKDRDDFFFVTQKQFFDALRKRQFNVVLQDNRNMTDDGSLSVYCGQKGIPYVNVEAQHGHLEQQVAMLEALVEVLEGDGVARP